MQELEKRLNAAKSAIGDKRGDFGKFKVEKLNLLRDIYHLKEQLVFLKECGGVLNLSRHDLLVSESKVPSGLAASSHKLWEKEWHLRPKVFFDDKFARSGGNTG